MAVPVCLPDVRNLRLRHGANEADAVGAPA
jgi:hypothetical protein